MNLYYLIIILTLNIVLSEVLTFSCFRTKSKSVLEPEEKDCIICQMKLTSEFSTHDCGCQYHNICINVWKIYKYNAKCPNCQKELLRERETPIGICIACLKNIGCKSMNKNCSHFYCEECFKEILNYYGGFCPICGEEYNRER